MKSTPETRRGLRRLSAGLIAYGIVGLIAAFLGLAALGWASGRVSTLADAVDAEATQLAVTLDATADTLRAAASSAETFAITLQRTPATVRQASGTIRNLRPNLEAIEGQLAAINILGAQPLADAARLFGEMSDGLAGLDTRLDLIANDLEVDRHALELNASDLRGLSDQTAAVAGRVRAGIIQRGLDDLNVALSLMILVFVGSMAVPAGGALAFGVWLRRTLADQATRG